jgi:hypothetical protein
MIQMRKCTAQYWRCSCTLLPVLPWCNLQVRMDRAAACLLTLLTVDRAKCSCLPCSIRYQGSPCSLFVAVPPSATWCAGPNTLLPLLPPLPNPSPPPPHLSISPPLRLCSSYYPGTGAATDIGVGRGRGRTINVAWSPPVVMDKRGQRVQVC